MTTTNVGDLICWTSNYGGFDFGIVQSYMKSGRPMVRPLGLDGNGNPWRVQQSGYNWMVIGRKTDKPGMPCLDEKIWAALEEYMKN